MTVVEESPSKTALKRKYENDSDDELFFKYENSAKKSLSTECQKENVDTAADSPRINSSLVHQLASPNNPKHPKLVQQKINFGSAAKSPKVAVANQIAEHNAKEEENVVAKKDEPAPETKNAFDSDDLAKKSKDDWNIEDYLTDKEWKSLLRDEFSKKYFLEINKNIKEGYKKGINRPPKELVFNALNSTKIANVNLFIYF